jgi:hypothetical protein
MARVDGADILPDTWYALKNGAFIALPEQFAGIPGEEETEG